MPTTYTRIVFMQGDDADEPLALLDSEGAEEAAIDFLAEWGIEEGPTTDEPSHGTDDDTYVSHDLMRNSKTSWLLSWSTSLNYIGLERMDTT